MYTKQKTKTKHEHTEQTTHITNRANVYKSPHKKSNNIHRHCVKKGPACSAMSSEEASAFEEQVAVARKRGVGA